ncbi:MAG: hypothetical protein EOP50_20705, partial [Sphingobacteriales bacterium]
MPVFPYILLFISLMPALQGGVRVEHLAAPLLVGFAGIRATRVHVDLLWPIGGLFFGLVVLGLSTRLSWQAGLFADPFTMFVRVLLPGLLLLAFPAILMGVSRPLLHTCNAIIAGAIFVAVLTLLTLVGGSWGDWIVFWVSVEADSVWSAALDIGRVTGIFGQPLEAGIFYSVSLFAIVIAWRTQGSWQHRVFLLIGLGATLVGGGLSLSKNFLFLGLGGAGALALMIGVISLTRAWVIGIPVSLLILNFGFQYNQNYFDSLYDLYREGGFITAASAGRFGLQESQVALLFSDITDGSDWLVGKGLGSFLPLDSGYLEFYYQGGALAMTGYVIF